MLKISLLFKRKRQTLRVNNLRILKIKNAEFSGYYFYMKLNIWGHFQICISVPLIRHFNLTSEWNLILLLTTLGVAKITFSRGLILKYFFDKILKKGGVVIGNN